VRIEVIPAEESAKTAVAALLQPYLREISSWFAPGQPPQEHYEYVYFDTYWQEPGERFPFLIAADGDVAGFVFVNRHSRLGNDNIHNVAEFYVKPEYRIHGVGLCAAGEIFRRFPGGWEVAVLRGNEAAEGFWHRAIAAVTVGPVNRRQTDAWNGAIFTFVVANRAKAT
jgi:predicted acetyltransferase